MPEMKGMRYAEALSKAFEVYKSVEIDTELVQIPSEENGHMAVASATVTVGDGNKSYTYKDYGDAAPWNVSQNIKPHLLRMAVTRAKARALRDSINHGEAIEEELGEAPVSGRSPAPEDAPNTSRGGAVAEISAGQKKAIENLVEGLPYDSIEAMLEVHTSGKSLDDLTAPEANALYSALREESK